MPCYLIESSYFHCSDFLLAYRNNLIFPVERLMFLEVWTEQIINFVLQLLIRFVRKFT